ncbi:SpoIIE family protein phosphatase [Streptomyces sp. NPDC058674]|uniref:SpoIIE family protein phosphatase n=1 Tax=Streptomyces sp. NPDC058674 TaxID=3346592 RepID=UPI00365AE6BF
MKSDAARPGDGPVPEALALSGVVARLRSEIADLEGVVATTAVVERAKGVLMARTGVSADAAYDTLMENAARRGRTLLEECWITLGRTGVRRPPLPCPPLAVMPAAPGGARGRRDPSAPPRTGGRDAARRAALAGLAAGLATVRGPDDAAKLLRAVLGREAGVDAVIVYAALSGGGLELVGHAGIDEALADRWRHVPPMRGGAARRAVQDGRARWLEEPEQDADPHPPVGGPPDRWASRAWLPAEGDGSARAVVGFLRTCRGTFEPPTRRLLERAVRMCRPALRPARPASGTGAGRAAVDAVQRILDALPGAAVLLTPVRTQTGEVADFRIDAATPGAVDAAGRRGKELVGRHVLETYPAVAGSALWEGYLDALTTGTAYEGEPSTPREGAAADLPERSVHSVRATRLGDALVVSWVRHDTGEREARRLADMQRLGNLGWAGWNLTAGTVSWSDQVYAVFDRDPALGPVGLGELPRHPVPEDRPGLLAAVERLLVAGEAVDQPFRIGTAHGIRHLRIVAEAQVDSDGVPVEVQGFFQDLTEQRGTELALLASERANLVQRGMLQAEHALAARLQDTLLPIPEQSLELAGLRVDVAYVPADSGVNVGGDWYSAIELPDRSALFVVGDVAGHGLAAVGTMAQLRFTTKGMTVTGSPLPEVLSRLNHLLLHTSSEPAGATATMVMARYQPWDRRLVWVRAGHLPPLLVRGGEATFLPQPGGRLLGAVFDSAYGQAVIDLLPGDHLLLYTDGLVEEPGEDIDDGLARLAASAAGLLRDGLGDTLGRSLAALRPGHRDDICVLDVHVPPDAAPAAPPGA